MQVQSKMSTLDAEIEALKTTRHSFRELMKLHKEAETPRQKYNIVMNSITYERANNGEPFSYVLAASNYACVPTQRMRIVFCAG